MKYIKTLFLFFMMALPLPSFATIVSFYNVFTTSSAGQLSQLRGHLVIAVERTGNNISFSRYFSTTNEIGEFQRRGSVTQNHGIERPSYSLKSKGSGFKSSTVPEPQETVKPKKFSFKKKSSSASSGTSSVCTPQILNSPREMLINRFTSSYIEAIVSGTTGKVVSNATVKNSTSKDLSVVSSMDWNNLQTFPPEEQEISLALTSELLRQQRSMGSYEGMVGIVESLLQSNTYFHYDPLLGIYCGLQIDIQYSTDNQAIDWLITFENGQELFLISTPPDNIPQQAFSPLSVHNPALWGLIQPSLGQHSPEAHTTGDSLSSNISQRRRSTAMPSRPSRSSMKRQVSASPETPQLEGIEETSHQNLSTMSDSEVKALLDSLRPDERDNLLDSQSSETLSGLRGRRATAAGIKEIEKVTIQQTLRERKERRQKQNSEDEDPKQLLPSDTADYKQNKMKGPHNDDEPEDGSGSGSSSSPTNLSIGIYSLLIDQGETNRTTSETSTEGKAKSQQSMMHLLKNTILQQMQEISQ
ncbi:hypothetical protein [Endozoicomonas sp. OPT23]|uniref:hypothetical protein n=1 Tax=Endozoicomonas sp. OPT23 TaxID=2072845 RepID=UPI00129BAEC5|nr:hypothetical protein [Endozoicomonas sp. OPT23]